MGKPVELKLQIADLTNNRLKDFVADVIALRDATKELAGASDPQYKALDRQATQLRQVSKNFGEAEQSATKFGGAMEKLAGPRSFISSALGGAGAGTFGNLAGLAGTMAAISAAGLLVGQSVKMAYEFERITTRAASQLGIGTATPLAANLAMYQAATKTGGQYGFNMQDTGAAMAAYGNAAGATAAQAAAAAPYITKYARAYGLDPGAVAGMVGQYQSYAGGSFQSNAGGLFGAAEEAGPMGRRIGEFISTATSVLTQLQMGAPTMSFGTGEVGGLVSGLSRLGGIYGTSAGVTSTLGAAQSLTQGGNADIRKAAFLYNAYGGRNIGASDLSDIITGGGDFSRHAGQAISYAEKIYGGRNSLLFKSKMAEMAGQQGGLLLEGAMSGSSGKYGSDIGFLNQRTGDGDQLATDKAAEAMNTTLGKIDEDIVTVQNAMTQVGQGILGALGTGNITLLLGGILAATAANALLSGGGGGAGGAIKGILSRVAPWALGALGEGGLAAAATGAAAIGGGAIAGVAGFSGLHWLLNSGGLHQDQTSNFLALTRAGVDESAARALATNAALPSNAKYAALYNAAGKKYDVPPALLAAIGQYETGTRNIIGDHGHGHGVMQIDDRSHADWLAGHKNGLDPASNIDYAAAMIADNWHSRHSIAAIGQQYNGGHVGAATTWRDGVPYEEGLKETVEAVTANYPNSGVHVQNNSPHSIKVTVSATPRPSAAAPPNTGNRIQSVSKATPTPGPYYAP